MQNTLSVQQRINRALLLLLKSPKDFFTFIKWKLRQFGLKKIELNGMVYFKYKGDLYPEYLHQGNAASHIVYKAQEFCKGYGIDIGAGLWPFPEAIPVDSDEQQNAYRLDSFAPSSLDYVFSSHCLEHLRLWEEALNLWISKLKIGGILFLYLPHESMKLWRPGAPWVGKGHVWKPAYQILLPWLQQHGMEPIEYNQFRDDYWSFHIVARRIS